MRDPARASGWETGPRTVREGQASAKRGRRKGALSVRETIDLAIAGGPNTLIAALNVAVKPGLAPPSDASVQELEEHAKATWDDTKETVSGIRRHTEIASPVRDSGAVEPEEAEVDDAGDLLPVFLALGAIRAIADVTIGTGIPKSQKAREILRREQYALGRSRDLILQALPRELPPVDSPDLAEVAKQVEEYRGLLDHIDRAMDLLNSFWSAPEAWLRRLRRCQYVGCRSPYFLDRAAAGHARYCSTNHRVYANRRAKKT